MCVRSNTKKYFMECVVVLCDDLFVLCYSHSTSKRTNRNDETELNLCTTLSSDVVRCTRRQKCQILIVVRKIGRCDAIFSEKLSTKSRKLRFNNNSQGPMTARSCFHRDRTVCAVCIHTDVSMVAMLHSMRAVG